VGWYSNKETPSFDGVVTSTTGGFKFPDGTIQTTAGGTTQPASQWYVVGPTDAVGTFAVGDTRLRTTGFNAPFVTVIRGGLTLTRGQHYTLDVDNIHIDGLDPLTADDQIEVQTKVTYSPSTAVSPQLVPLTVASGLSFIAFAHVVGFAPLLNGGVWLNPGTDYTEDATGYYLQGFLTGANDSWAAWNLTPITLANMLSKNNPTIGSGPLTFADGSQQSTSAAPLSGRNRIINGSCIITQYVGQNLVAGTNNVYGTVDRFNTSNNAGTGATIQIELGSIAYNSVTYSAVQVRAGTPATTLGGTAYIAGVAQPIEGVHCYDLIGQPVAIQFLFAASVAGTYAVSLRDGNSTHSYVTTFNYAVASVPQLVKILVPPIIGTANLPASSGTGLVLWIGAVNGASGNYATANLNVWQSGNFITATTAVQWPLTTNATIDVTNVQLEAGTACTPFEFEPWSITMQKCMRYRQYTPIPIVMQYAPIASYAFYGDLLFSTSMRATPAATLVSAPNYQNATSLTISPLSAMGGRFNVTAVGVGASFAYNNAPSVYWLAEL
jgi:hypothetical protein